ncbi:MAG: hypothetical protein LAP13_19485 [Acidobacteriia bacterium]|nr:hypothetical protein [Terriglobia bacterium]
MRTLLKASLASAAVALLALGGLTPALAAQDKGQMVIIFRDGRRQTFSLAEIARVEFENTSTTSYQVGSAKFMGRWKVGDGAGGTFEITLQPAGKAHKTLGQADGTWTVVKGEALITWKDGWRDIIRKSGRKYQKVAYQPGASLDDPPNNTADAEYLEGQ